MHTLEKLWKLTQLCQTAGIPLKPLYRPGGYLYQASITLYGHDNLRWTDNVVPEALAAFHRSHPTAFRSHQNQNQATNEDTSHIAEETDITDDVGSPEAPETPKAPKRVRRHNRIPVTSHYLSEAGRGDGAPETPRSNWSFITPPDAGQSPASTHGSVGTGLEDHSLDVGSYLNINDDADADDADYTNDADYANDLYVSAMSSNLEVIHRHNSEDGEVNTSDHAVVVLDDEDDVVSTLVPPQAAERLQDGHSLLGGNLTDDTTTAARFKAIQQLRNWDMLSDDSIAFLQDAIRDSLQVPSTTVILYPLYFRPGYYLPSALPLKVRTKQATTIMAISHHGNPKHWTLLRISINHGLVSHYDPCPTPQGYASVIATIKEWQEKFLPDTAFTFTEMASPRQSDAVSCGAYAVVALKHLLEGHEDLSGLALTDSDARQSLLRIAKRTGAPTVTTWFTSYPAPDSSFEGQNSSSPKRHTIATSTSAKRGAPDEPSTADIDDRRPTKRAKLDEFFELITRARTIAAEIDDKFPLSDPVDTVHAAERALQTASEDFNTATNQLRVRFDQGEAAQEAETRESKRYTWTLAWVSQKKGPGNVADLAEDMVLDAEIKKKMDELDSWLGNAVAAAELKALKAANAARQAMEEVAEARQRLAAAGPAVEAARAALHASRATQREYQDHLAMRDAVRR